MEDIYASSTGSRRMPQTKGWSYTPQRHQTRQHFLGWRKERQTRYYYIIEYMNEGWIYQHVASNWEDRPL